MLESVASALTLAVICLAALGVGRPVLRSMGIAEVDWLGACVWSLATGLIVSGTALGALGLCGLLYRPLIGVLTIAAALAGLAKLLRKGSGIWDQGSGDTAGDAEGGRESFSASAFCQWKDRWPKKTPDPFFAVRAIAVLAALAGLAALTSALAPPTAGDALCYHLELPKTFLAEHRLVFSPYNDNAAFPLLVEMWYLWALALDGGVAAQLVHWAMGVLLALATVVLGAPLLGRSWAWVAGGLILLVPCVTNQMSAPLNDVALAVFTTLALAAWRRIDGSSHTPWAVTGNGTRCVPAANLCWAVIAGLMLGGAMATKFTAFVFIAAVATPWAWDVCTRPRERRGLILAASITLLVASGVAGLWYARAAWHWGNPLYPYFSEYLGEPGPLVMPESKTPLGWDVLSFLSAPWKLTMHPEQFGGRGYQFGGLFLAVLPVLLVTRRLRGLGMLLMIAGVYAALWYALRQNLRFLLPVVPLLAIAAAWVWIELWRFPRLPRCVTAAACAGMLLAQAAIPVLRCRQHLPVALGLESRDQYLARTEPTYAVAQAANHMLPADARLLSQEYRAFYFDCQVTRESIFRRREAYDQQLAHPGELSRVLRAAGFSHLLLAESTGGGIRYRGGLRRLADQQSADSSPLTCLFECRFADSDGATRRYRLMELR